MKRISNYKIFNESVKDFLKPKSEEDIINIIKKKLNKKDLTWWEYAKYWIMGNDDIKLMIENTCNKDEKEILRKSIRTYMDHNIVGQYRSFDDLQHFSLFSNTNESVKDFLKPRSEEHILNLLNDLSDSEKIKKIIKHKLPYKYLPDNLIVDGYLDCSYNNLTSLPDNLTVNGTLDCRCNKLTKLPNNLKVSKDLNCGFNQLNSLPNDLVVGKDIYCHNNFLTFLPDNLTVYGSLYCQNNILYSLPDNLLVYGSLDCSGNDIDGFPDNLIVGKKLYYSNSDVEKIINFKKPNDVGEIINYGHLSIPNELNTMTESIRQYLKPKSEEEVLKILLNSNINDIDLLIKSVEYNLKSGVLLALQKICYSGKKYDRNTKYYLSDTLMWSVKYNHADVLQLLLDKCNKLLDINIKYGKPLRMACYEGYYDITKILLENGADVHAGQGDSMRWAATNGDYRLVQLLLDYGADPSKGLYGAIKYKHIDVIKLLKKYIK